MKKFWNWTNNEEGQMRTLHLNGTIAEESWFDDDVTPQLFNDELCAQTTLCTINPVVMIPPHVANGNLIYIILCAFYIHEMCLPVKLKLSTFMTTSKHYVIIQKLHW